ncbi:hypothetical protein HHL11_03355 [Ramlibacter sp. G-1-2-2]|uniref:Glycosyltransferase (GlcNAc) n=1 Tax=Ramlibacter agri TaxID=2728837 RepID=A0A848GWP2_9BURK|nr:hypothetical protein [Ramlibacter agri]
MRTLFVSIASYCDPVLPFTLQRAVETARHPDGLHFGIVDQALPGMEAASQPPATRVSEVRIDALQARGPCWARAIALSLYDGEDWFLQLDSHMDFEAGWDEKLVEQARALGAPERGIVISSYPPAFAFEAGRPVLRGPGGGVLAHVLKPGVAFEADHPVLSFEAHPVDGEAPLPAFHLGAGCLFAPGRFAQAFPYDPWFYFHGEEQALALRLYTHGWDLFHMPRLPIRHLYNDAQSGAPPRPLHWDAAHEALRSEPWWAREQRSRDRLAALVAGEPLGAYGLGCQRSVADYAAFSGIDYAARTLAPHAFTPKLA